MPIDDPQEQQDETLMQPSRLRPMYPDFGPAALADDDQAAGLGDGYSPVSQQLPTSDNSQFQRQFGAPPQAEPKPSIGQRILALGQQGTPFDANAAEPSTTPKTVGSSILSGVRQATDSWQAPRLALRSGVPPASLDFNQEQQGMFGSFVPEGADSAASESRNKPTHPDSSIESPLDEQPHPQTASGGQGGIVNASGMTRQPSKIHRPTNAPDVLPNLRIGDPRGLRKTLGGLMQSIRKSPPPKSAQPIVQSRGRSVTLTYPDGRKETRRGNHPQRDNNPGNMEAGSFSSNHGQIGKDRGFAVFPSAEAGWAAMDARLRSDLYWNLSIDKAVETWAPPKNAKGQVINDTTGYQKKVREAVGVTGNTNISTLTPQQFEALKQAMARVEGFYESRPKQKVKVAVQAPKPQKSNPKQ